MRTVKYSNLTKKKHRYPTTVSLAYLRPQFDEQCFNITPLDISAHRA